MNRVYLFVNGILSWPGNSRNWTGRAVTYTHLAGPAKAEKVEYYCGPISRAFGQKDRSHKLYLTSSFYRDWEQIMVGHSNGADVILSMMRDYPNFPHVSALHLVCGATNADFNLNGLNFMLGLGRVDNVFVYVAGKDAALRLAHTVPGKLLGYGTLGLHGPQKVDPRYRNKVHVIDRSPWTRYGHSDCWHDLNFKSTMDAFLI